MASLTDPDRLRALRATELLDSPPEPAFERLTRLAARLLGTPVAAVSLVDDRRQFFKSALGLPEPWASRRGTPLSHSFCATVVETESVLVVEDSGLDARVCGNLAVAELGVAAYLGVPIISSGRHILGALCVIDGRPRRWTPTETETLFDLAGSVVSEIELRNALRAAEAQASALRAAAEHHRLLAEHSSDLVRVHAPDGRHTYVSPSSERLLGYTPAELLALPRGHLLPEQDRAPVAARFAAEIRGEEGRAPLVHRLVARSGEVRWFETNLRAVRDSSGVVLQVNSASRDITDRLRAEHELHEREARLRLLADSAFEGIALSHEGFVIDGNEAFAQMFGYSLPEIVGMPAGSFVVPSERERVGRHQREGSLEAYETIGERKGGSTFPLEVRARMVPWGERTVRITAMRDISERVRAEQTRRLHGEVLANMAEGVCVVRVSDAVIIYANLRFEGMFGYGRGELEGRPVSVLHPTPDARAGEDGDVAAIIATLETHGRATYEARNVRKDGGALWCRATTSTMIHPEHGKVWVAVQEDITAQKREAAALARQSGLVDLLRATATEANSASTSDEAMQACLGRVCEQMRWPIGHVFLARSGSAGAPELVSTGLWHDSEPGRFTAFRSATSGTRLALGEGLPGRVLASSHAEWMDDVSNNAAFIRRAAARESGLRGGFAFPVLVGSEVAAVLEFFSPRVEPPDAPLLAVMADVGAQVGRVIERERAHLLLERHAAAVRALSLEDELTGLRNRRGFFEIAGHQLKVVDRAGGSALLFFADVNGLKIINDTLGHEHGDDAIRLTAQLLKRTFRETDVVARLGGDEFVVFAAGAGAEELHKLRARLQAAVDEQNARSGNRPFRLSLGLGAAIYDAHAPRSLETLLAEADALMYEQKRARAKGPRAGAL